MESDVDSLLEFLLSKGQIPSFSFPLDTTVFAAESKNKKKFSHIARYSRDTKLAISELAPGQQRTVNGKKMEVGGLYFEYSKDPVNRAVEFFRDFNSLNENRVSLCLNRNCGWISENKTDNLTETLCPICSKSSDPELDKKNVKTYLLLKPEGFSPICVPHYDGRPHNGMKVNANTDFVRPITHKNTTKKKGRFSGRAKLPAPNTDDISSGMPIWNGNGQWDGCNIYVAQDLANQGLGTEFVLINTGPEEEGFSFCEDCGASMHDDHLQKYRDTSKHFRPYIIEAKDYAMYGKEEKDEIQKGCSGSPVRTHADLPIALGIRFRTDIALFRFDLYDLENCSFDWSTPEFHGAVMAFRDSIQAKMVEKLELMNREISAGYRLVTSDTNRYVDIFLYDSVSGGAGLVSQIKNIVPEMEDFLQSAMDHLDGRSCLENKACSRACVGCLLDFKNRIDHDVINRPLGWSLARYFKQRRAPDPSDFGISPEGDVIDRVQNAVNSYSTFINDDSKSIQVQEQNRLEMPNGKIWEIVSPLNSKVAIDRMKIDEFEMYPSDITDNFDMKENEENWDEMFS